MLTILVEEEPSLHFNIEWEDGRSPPDIIRLDGGMQLVKFGRYGAAGTHYRYKRPVILDQKLLQIRHRATEPAYGFIRVVLAPGEAMGKFLAANRAITDWTERSRSNVWWGPDGRVVAMWLKRDGETEYWVRADLVTPEMLRYHYADFEDRHHWLDDVYPSVKARFEAMTVDAIRKRRDHSARLMACTPPELAWRHSAIFAWANAEIARRVEAES